MAINMAATQTSVKNTIIPRRVSERLGLISSVQSDAELQSVKTTYHSFSGTSQRSVFILIRPANGLCQKSPEMASREFVHDNCQSMNKIPCRA